jgi:hypothetical protein
VLRFLVLLAVNGVFLVIMCLALGQSIEASKASSIGKPYCRSPNCSFLALSPILLSFSFFRSAAGAQFLGLSVFPCATKYAPVHTHALHQAMVRAEMTRQGTPPEHPK